MKIAYEQKRFSAGSLAIIAKANDILEEYARQGFDLTLRQLYYQFVARGEIANKQTEYKRLGSIVNDARMAGLIDWYSIVDRTRNLRALPHWNSPASLMRSALAGFANDKWADQPWYVEVWIEKDALVGVIQGVCNDLDVPYFSCRGYTSQSEMWGAAQRLGRVIQAGRSVKIVHLGDHDPSGIDMTRDIDERLLAFVANDAYREDWWDGLDPKGVTGRTIERLRVDRVALTWEQIEEYEPPPNPAKLTDSRGAGYVARYGSDSWELDALEPTVMAELIQSAVDDVLDPDLWEQAVEREQAQKAQIKAASDRWDEVVAFLGV